MVLACNNFVCSSKWKNDSAYDEQAHLCLPPLYTAILGTTLWRVHFDGPIAVHAMHGITLGRFHFGGLPKDLRNLGTSMGRFQYYGSVAQWRLKRTTQPPAKMLTIICPPRGMSRKVVRRGILTALLPSFPANKSLVRMVCWRLTRCLRCLFICRLCWIGSSWNYVFCKYSNMSQNTRITIAVDKLTNTYEVWDKTRGDALTARGLALRSRCHPAWAW